MDFTSGVSSSCTLPPTLHRTHAARHVSLSWSWTSFGSPVGHSVSRYWQDRVLGFDLGQSNRRSGRRHRPLQLPTRSVGKGVGGSEGGLTKPSILKHWYDRVRYPAVADCSFALFLLFILFAALRRIKKKKKDNIVSGWSNIGLCIPNKWLSFRKKRLIDPETIRCQAERRYSKKEMED